MNTERCNGWSNYQTWVIMLWLDQEYWRERTNEACDIYDLAAELKDMHTKYAPETTDVHEALLTEALDRVDWQEIAEFLWEDWREEEEEEE